VPGAFFFNQTLFLKRGIGLNEDLKNLVSLQKLDAEMARICQRKKELPNRISQLEESFRALTEKVEDEKQRLEEVVKAHRAKEESLKRGIENLKKTKERLFEVKTNKEYQAMLKEIDGIVKKNGEIEDEIIVKLEEIDSAKSSLKTIEANLSDYRAGYEKERNEIERELGLIDSEMAQLTRGMEETRGKMGEETLKRYDKIRKRRNGSAVVSVWKGVCEGCHMNLPPQMYNELQKSEEIMLCPFCSRILYWSDRGKNG
jgi:predicted  nucleic acid-binding Zn-ribbon protein